ncbi:MAG: sensor histidine kinase, partial [Nitrospiraceae bacterium]
SEIGRMETTIRHILDSTHIQVRHSAIDLNDIIRDVLGLVAPMLGTQRVCVKMDLLPGLPLIAGDRNMIRGMVLNLITNACQAMPNGGELTVETLESEDRPVTGFVALTGALSSARPAVRFIVRDTGHGIPSDRLQRIFEPFFTTRRGEGGTGLGLMICRRAVSSSGGRFVVQSVPECGTTFTIDLPLSKDSFRGANHA